jgi:AraC-like DNA-binding protein
MAMPDAQLAVTKSVRVVPSMAAGINAPERPADERLVTPESASVRRLAQVLERYAPHDGRFELRRPGVFALRWSRPSHAPVHVTQRPALCVVAQGGKLMMLGNEMFAYDAARMLVFSVDLPVTAQVTTASPKAPYLGFKLEFDPRRVAELATRVPPDRSPIPASTRGLYVGHTSEAMVDAVTRLLLAMGQESDTDLYAPLIIDEILIRLLRSPVGGRVAQIGNAESRLHRIATAINWLREHYAQPTSVDELARLVHMSVSSFHQHFKTVTSMSPVQYQKVMRLHEARRLMLFHDREAADAARMVGYLSASQFSREYARFFGQAPMRDVALLRAESGTATPVAKPS